MELVSRDVAFPTGDLVIRGEERRPDPSRGTVLFLHGGGQTRHAWGGGARLLAEAGWTAVAVDLRGHGDSDWASDGRYDLAAYASDVRAVCAELGGDVVLVGASLGGMTALTLAAEPGGLVRALVLVDIVPRPEPEGVRRIVAFMTGHLDGFDSLDDVADAVAEYTGRPRRTDIGGLRKNVRQRADGRWYWHWDPALMRPDQNEEPRPGSSGDALMAAAGAVRVPVLVVRGGASDVVGDTGIQELADALDDVDVVTVPGARHMVAGDDNDAFVAAVRRFLDARFGPGGAAPSRMSP
ncbi:MAG: alpha/beta hydrolase [Actinomycetales bacterium]|nr:alpha/beta hydrolase [Actinomycetales bacterium]